MWWFIFTRWTTRRDAPSRARNSATTSINFEALDCVVIGVSTDSAERHRAFAEKHALPFILLADEGGRIASAFGALKDKYAARSTFVFDRDLRLRRAFHEVTARGHAAQVLNFVRTLVESHRMLGG